MSADAALTIAMAAGWLALVVGFVWPSSPHCRCCLQRVEEEQRRVRR